MKNHNPKSLMHFTKTFIQYVNMGNFIKVVVNLQDQSFD